MTFRTIVDAELEVYLPTNSGSTPDTTVPAPEDLLSLDTTERIQDHIDTSIIRIENDGGTYTGDITSGDRVVFRTQLDGEGGLSDRWTGMVRGVTHRERGGGKPQRLDLIADDFVFGVMHNRIVENAFNDKQVAGPSDAVLNTILTNNASEIGQGQIETFDETTSVEWNARNLFEASLELARRVDALMAQDGTDLIFKRLTAPAPEFTLTDTDRGLLTVEENDDRLTNHVRVEGGEDTNVDDEQLTQSSTETVTDSNRVTQQISTRKSEVTKIEIHTETTGSGDNLVVRLQSDDGGSPKDVSSRESDIARRTLASDFLANGDFTTFLMPEHSLANPDPWIIVESDGSTGQDVGVDGSGNLTYKAHYPFPLATIVEDSGSIDEYRRREGAIHDPSLTTKAQTEATGTAAVRHAKEPERTAEFVALSSRAQGLSVGEAVTVDESAFDFQADAIVVERRDRYGRGPRDHVTLETTLTVQDVNTV